MDARERLRRYLEQRRELGETELVLDRLAVDDVMAMLGAREAPKARGARSGASHEPPKSTPVAPLRPAAEAPPVVDASPNATSDVTGHATPQDTAAPARDVPQPTSRLDPTASGDWRQALRHADVTAKTGDAPREKSPTSNSSPATDAMASRAASLPTWLLGLNLPAGLTAPLGERNGDAPEIDGLHGALDLDGIATLVRACTRCALHATARHAVPGEGSPHAELLCVGEAPGANEDELGRPFVGEAGQLLTKILAAIDLPRESVYICNVLKHRPPGNRDPLPDEVAACQPFLRRQILTVRPRVIIALGRFAAQTLLGTTTSLGRLREQIHVYHGIPVIVTYHPAALLRNEAYKRPTWSDVKLARRILDASRDASAGDPAS